jgi:hypothetical protein
MVYGHYTEPYTWKLARIDREVSIRSKEAAVKWAKQTFHRAFVTGVVEIKPTGKETV